MSAYQVVYTQLAETNLAELWLQANDQESLAWYANVLDKALATMPSGYGESREQNIRLAFFRPLCVLYDVVEDTKQVFILALKWVGR